MSYTLEQFSAACRRILTDDRGPEGRRKVCALTRSTFVRLVPHFSLWMRLDERVRSSSTPVRVNSPRSASSRVTPAFVFRFTISGTQFISNSSGFCVV